MIIYNFLILGLAGLVFALYGRTSEARFLGGLAATLGLLVAVLHWGQW